MSIHGVLNAGRLSVYMGVFAATALTMTLYEGAKELLFHGALTPWQSHSITIFVTASLSLLATAYVRAEMVNRAVAEHELKSREEKLRAQGLVMTAVNHIVRNFANNFTLLEAEYMTTGTISAEAMVLLKGQIREVESQLKRLGEVSDLAVSEDYPADLLRPAAPQ